MTTEDDVKLRCGIVSWSRNSFMVKIVKTRQVAELEDEIKRKCGIPLDVDIQLFAAKLTQHRLKASAVEANLKNGTTNDVIEALSKGEELRVWDTVNEALPDVLSGDAIHVLALPPRGTKRPGGVFESQLYKRHVIEPLWAPWSEPYEVPSLKFSGRVVRLSRKFLQGSGLHIPIRRDELVLFRREGIEALCNRIRST